MSVRSESASFGLSEPDGWLASLPFIAAAISVALGAVVLLGWALDLAPIKSVMPGLATMKAGAAAGFVLGGASLMLLLRGEPGFRWARVCAAAMLAVTVVVEYGVVNGPESTEAAQARSGFQTVLAFAIQGVALLLLTSERPVLRTLGQEAALVASAIGWVGLIGYAYTIERLYSLNSVSEMAVHTAFGITLLGFGTAAADPANGPLRLLRSQGPGGALARHLMPFVILTPFVLGGIHLAGQRAGLFEPALGVAALTVASTVLFAFIVATYAGRLDRSDDRRQSAERVLRESAEFNTQIVASAQEGIVVVDEQRRCVLWNPFMERLTGIAAHEIAGRPLTEAASFGVLSQSESMDRALAGQHVEGDFEHRDRSGESAWLLVTHTPLRNAEGGIRGAIITIHDITELKRAEQALRDSQKRMSTALATAGVGVWEIDLQTRAVVWTENATLLLASPVKAVRGLDDIVSGMHADDRLAVVSAVERAIATRSDFDIESRVILPDGSTRWLRSTGRATGDQPPAEAGRLIGITTDVTSRRLLEAQFLQAQKMEAVGRLAGGVAHDFNNLLTAILGYSALLQEGMVDFAHRKSVNEVIKAATRATALTRQLLAFSRQQAPEATVLDANDVVQDLLDMLRRLIGENVSLTTSLRDRLDSVRIDRGQLEQVIVNLVVNARDAMPRGGTIEIATAHAHVEAGLHAHGAEMLPGDYVTLAVRDTGMGMSDDVRTHLFQPFFTTKAPGKGTGLGLATVDGIVTACHGYVAVESELGTGSLFRVYLPSVVAPGHETAIIATEPAIGPDVCASSVLIVEDEEAVRYLTRVILERAGHRVFEAGTPEEAEAILADRGHIDILVADIGLPGVRGTELFARMRTTLPMLGVVFMSGYSDEGILDENDADPFVVFIQKPFSADTLLSSVARLLGVVTPGR